MRRLHDLSEEEYLEIEDALASNARGRAFLRMRDQRGRLVATSDVRRLARELREEWRKQHGNQNESAHSRILREELREMSAYIHQTRREIAALRPADGGSNNRIMAATGELDAIVSATERATSDILNAAERIQALADKLPQDGETGTIAQEVGVQVIEILTACSFQDITGQRTSKVVNTLRYLEQRVNSMIEIWGVDGSVKPAALPQLNDPRPDAHLMNGPALDGGTSQADVDALLAQLEVAGGATAEPPAPKEPPSAPPPAPKPAAVSPEPAAAPAEAGRISSQSEIDALFS